MKLALLGTNIQESKSPKLYRHFGAIAGININYELIDTEFNSLEKGAKLNRIVKEFFRNEGHGLSVTSPFKRMAFDICDQHHKSAMRTQSVNTIVRKNDRLIGYNTDLFGFEKALTSRINLGGIKKVLIIGTGAVVRTLIHVLNKRGTDVYITGRNLEEANLIASEYINGHVFPVHMSCLDTHYDLVVNATPNGDALPNTITYSVAYSLSYHETPFSRSAKIRCGCSILGDEMLLYQAIEAFEVFSQSRISLTKNHWLLYL